VIGSGNVAWHLINTFQKAGLNILQILGHNEKSAAKLSSSFSIPYITDPDLLVRDADLYLLAVQDDRIGQVAQGLGLTDQFLVHTSGFSPVHVLAGASANTGVLWPIQSLTAGKAVSFKNIPVLVEGNLAGNTERLIKFAGLVSTKVISTNSETRQKAHLAAVIASNLANRLYSISAEILERENLSFKLLEPLISETARKAARRHPLASQTGPAARNDLNVIFRHLELLGDDPEFKEIYRILSENIMKHYYGKSK
jgi:predicted short-subunit dehydrogenase-like oxidoreductase (DUF2520 family)